MPSEAQILAGMMRQPDCRRLDLVGVASQELLLAAQEKTMRLVCSRVHHLRGLLPAKAIARRCWLASCFAQQLLNFVI